MVTFSGFLQCLLSPKRMGNPADPPPGRITEVEAAARRSMDASDQLQEVCEEVVRDRTSNIPKVVGRL